MAARRGRLAEILSLVAGLVAALLIGYALGTYFLRQVTAPSQQAVMEALSSSESAANGQAGGEAGAGSPGGSAASGTGSRAGSGTDSGTGSGKDGQGAAKQDEPLLTTLEDESYSKSSGDGNATPAGNPGGSSAGSTPEPKVKLFKVQVGSFQNREDAIQFAKKLEKDGYQPYVTKQAPYTAQVGAFSLQEKAQALARELKGKGYQVRVTNE